MHHRHERHGQSGIVDELRHDDGHDAHAEHKDRAGTRAEQRLEHLKHERGNAAFGVGQRPGQRQREGEDKNDGPGHALVHHGAPRKQSLSFNADGAQQGHQQDAHAGIADLFEEDGHGKVFGEETGQHHEDDERDEEAQKQLLDAGQRHVRFLDDQLDVERLELADVGPEQVLAQSDEQKQAEEAVRECFGGTFGDAGNTVVIEEMLTGPECSLLAFTDGKTVRPMATSQDHKRALEGDKGPNTGGMGVYSPVPIVTDEEHATMVKVMEQTVAELAAEGIDYRGCLYGGFMLTPAGPKVLEFNARFGDPETQVVLPRLKNDLVEVMLACANCELDQIELDWRDEWAVAVVLTSAGYPGSYEKGKVITGIADAEAMENVTVYHAGTAVVDGQLVTNGGRVLAVTALGDTFENARNLAYEACEKIDFEGKTLRHDIGLRALRGRDAWDA